MTAIQRTRFRCEQPGKLPERLRGGSCIGSHRAHTNKMQLRRTQLFGLLTATALLPAGCAYYKGGWHRRIPAWEMARISVQQARRKVRGGKALLVSAYEDDLSFYAIALEGAISIHDFRKRYGQFPKDKLVIFYCN